MKRINIIQGSKPSMLRTLPKIIFDPTTQIKSPSKQSTMRSVNRDEHMHKVRSRSKEINEKEQQLIEIYHAQLEERQNRYQRNKQRFLLHKVRQMEMQSKQWETTRQNHKELYEIKETYQDIMYKHDFTPKKRKMPKLMEPQSVRISTNVVSEPDRSERAVTIVNNKYYSQLEQLDVAQKIWQKRHESTKRNQFKRKPFYHVDELKNKLLYNQAVDFNRPASSLFDKIL